MNLNRKGVSPVVGTILLVAITVVSAGTVAYFVMNQTGQTKPAPTVNVTFDNAAAASDNFTIAHDGGDSVTDAFSLGTSGKMDAL